MTLTNMESKPLTEQIKKVESKLKNLKTLESIEMFLYGNDDTISKIYYHISKNNAIVNHYTDFDVEKFVDKISRERELPLKLLVNEDMRIIKILMRTPTSFDWELLTDNNIIIMYVAVMIRYGYSVKY